MASSIARRVVCTSPSNGPATPDSAADAAVAAKEARQDAAMKLSEWWVVGCPYADAHRATVLKRVKHTHPLPPPPSTTTTSMFSWNYGVIGGMVSSRNQYPMRTTHQAR